MGLFDIFGGGTGPEKALKLKAKATQKYGDPTTRQKALEQLAAMDIPEAVTALMGRFTLSVDPATTDEDEKDSVFQLIVGRGKDAVAPVTQFLLSSDSASSWALRILEEIAKDGSLDLIGVVIGVLEKVGAGYARDPEKKLVMLNFLEGKDDPRVVPAVLPFLDDTADDVKIAAARVLAPKKDERFREPLLNALTGDESSKRVQTALVTALFETGFGVQGYREKVEAIAKDPYFVDKSGVLKKRG
ncbi:MAG: HEAT repeat domain-containing protein [Myxococcaceae bacterium]